MTPTIVTFCGAGGTGKTSVMQALAASLGYKATVCGSIVREVYAKTGLQSEAELAALDTSAKFDFQLAFLKAFVDSFEERAKDCRTPYLISDRSVYDHVGYLTYYSNTLITREGWNSEILPLIRRFVDLKPIVIRFPLPPWWSVEAASDGFRQVTFGKELVMDALMGSFSAHHHPGRLLWTLAAGDSTVADRVAMIGDILACYPVQRAAAE